MSNLVYGKNTTLKLGASTIAAVVNLSINGRSVGEIDVTNLSSDDKAYRPGLPEPGSISATIQYDPADATHSALTDLMAEPEMQTWSIVLTDTGTTSFSADGFLTSFEVEGMEQENVVTANIEVKLSGPITIA